MKPSSLLLPSKCVTLPFVAIVFLGSMVSCSSMVSYSEEIFISEHYGHFEGGVLFNDFAQGLDVLWQASFKNRRVYKENAAFFVPEGLLILPNVNNTTVAAELSVLPLQIIDGRINVLFRGEYLPVLAIFHTHIVGVSEPTPMVDYQYGYLGIHNYVMSYAEILDAYKTQEGTEIYKRLGSRTAYATLIANMAIHSSGVKLASAGHSTEGDVE